VRELVSKKHCIDVLLAMEARPLMYGSTREIEAIQHVIYSLLCDEREQEKFNDLRYKAIKEILGDKALTSFAFSHQIKEDDYVLMVLFLKKIREGFNIS